MKMKNIAAVAMAGCMAASLAACGGSASTAASTETSTAASTEAATGEESDVDAFEGILGSLLHGIGFAHEFDLLACATSGS